MIKGTIDPGPVIRRVACLISFVMITAVSPAFSDVDKGVNFVNAYEDAGVRMELKGTGLKRYFIFKAFIAGLYLGEGVAPHDVLGDVPKRLEVAYLAPVPARQLCQETRRRIARNISKAEWNALKEKIDIMDSYFVDIRPGDRYALTYVPGAGTKFEYNGRLVGSILGADFSSALFSVWFGPFPLEAALKSKLLGLK